MGPDLRIRWFTPQAEKHLNLIASDIGRPIDDIKLPIVVPDLHEVIARVIDTVTVHEIEVQDNQGRWYSLRLRPYRTMDNRIEGAMLALTDIDVQRRSGDALRDANRHKDEFLAMLGHELRNPLAPLRSHLELLRAGGVQRRRASASVEVMNRQVAHLTRLVGDLLDVARIGQGRIGLRFESVDPAEMAHCAAAAMASKLTEKGRRLSVNLPAEPLLMRGDEVRLDQLMTNLLDNAIKYTDEGGLIELSIARDGDQAVLDVTDDGIGMAPDVLPRIFELFVQSNTAPGRENHGLGVGLALVRMIAELHGGSVHAESPGLGRGSRFTVRLPLATSSPKPVAPDAEGSTMNDPSKLRILLVDDNVDGANSLAMLLKRAGHEVRVTYSAHEGTEAFEDFKPDVGILDVGLPDADGCDLARRLHALPTGRDVPLIALTGYSPQTERRRFDEAGFKAIFTKPITMATLQPALADVVSRS